MRGAIGAAAIGWLALADGCLSASRVLDRELSRADAYVHPDPHAAYEPATNADVEAKVILDRLSPVFEARRAAWVYGKGFFDVRGYNFVPWWIASADQRHQYTSLTAELRRREALYRPDPAAVASLVASVGAWLAANPERPRLARIPAAPKWILFEDVTGRPSALHARLREEVVGTTAAPDTFFAVPIAHHYTRVRRPSADPSIVGSLMRMRCYDAVDLLVGTTRPFSVLGVVVLGTPRERMVADYDKSAADITALLSGNSSAFDAELRRIRLGTAREETITEEIDDPEGCALVAAPMEDTFAGWLRY